MRESICVYLLSATCCFAVAIQFDLSGAVDKDVIYETSGGASSFGEAGGASQSFVQDGYNDGDEIADGLPTSGGLASSQPGLGTYALEPFNGNNVIELASGGGAPNEEHVIDVPDRRYVQLGMLVSAVNGDVSFTLKLNYLDGTATTNWWEADDWYQTGGDLRASQHVIISAMDRIQDVGTGEIDDANHYSLFEFLVTGDLDSSKVLDSVTIGNTPNRWNDGGNGWGGVFAMNGEYAIPEPMTLLLAVFGGGIFYLRRRSRRAW